MTSLSIPPIHAVTLSAMYRETRSISRGLQEKKKKRCENMLLEIETSETKVVERAITHHERVFYNRNGRVTVPAIAGEEKPRVRDTLPCLSESGLQNASLAAHRVICHLHKKKRHAISTKTSLN